MSLPGIVMQIACVREQLERTLHLARSGHAADLEIAIGRSADRRAAQVV
jgi:hypothetical protein